MFKERFFFPSAKRCPLFLVWGMRRDIPNLRYHKRCGGFGNSSFHWSEIDSRGGDSKRTHPGAAGRAGKVGFGR